MTDSQTRLSPNEPRFEDIHRRNVVIRIPGKNPFSGIYKRPYPAIFDLLKRFISARQLNPGLAVKWTELHALENPDYLVVVGRCELGLNGKAARSRVVIEARATKGKVSSISLLTSNQAALDRVLRSLVVES